MPQLQTLVHCVHKATHVEQTVKLNLSRMQAGRTTLETNILPRRSVQEITLKMISETLSVKILGTGIKRKTHQMV